MSASKVKRYGIFLAMVYSTAILLSLIWNVPYLYTVIGFAAWAFVGHVVTVEDDLRGGWSNPDGSIRFPWTELTIKAAVLLGLLGLLFFIPALKTLGA